MKNEKGYTGIDIAISVVVIFIFVSVIANLSYQFNSSSQEIELKAKATTLAIDEIENMKKKDFEEIKDKGLQNDDIEYVATQEVQGKENQGFYKTVEIEDYVLNHPEAKQGLVKKVTVKIEYNFKNKRQTVKLSTILSNPNRTTEACLKYYDLLDYFSSHARCSSAKIAKQFGLKCAFLV